MQDSICTCRSRWTSAPSCRWCGAWQPGVIGRRRRAKASREAAPGRFRGLYPRLPGTRHARGLDCLLDRETRLTRLRLRTQAARDGVEEGAHERGVGMRAMELLFHPVDELQEIFLIAPRKRHPRDGALHGDERLVYGSSLVRVHHLMHWTLRSHG